MDIDIQWGGYYASRETGDQEYGVFRLLDFNREAYHVAIYKEKFKSIPTIGDVRNLAPYIGHAPVDSKALLRAREVNLLGGNPLTETDLEGYRFYLEHHEVPASKIAELFTNLHEFCAEPPLRLRLELKDGELAISDR